MREFLPDKPEHRAIGEMKQCSGSGEDKEVAVVQHSGEGFTPRRMEARLGNETSREIGVD
jgi:hypothetical protein